MLHGAYSCLHYRGILQDLDLEDSESFSIPPADVKLEVGIAFGLILLGELLNVGLMQPVEVISATKRKPLQAPPYRTRDFDIYANRSKAL